MKGEGNRGTTLLFPNQNMLSDYLEELYNLYKKPNCNIKDKARAKQIIKKLNKLGMDTYTISALINEWYEKENKK